MIRVLLLDDHALLREGVARLFELEPDMRVVGSFDAAEAALTFAATDAPDVAIVEVPLKRGNGIEVARRLRHLSPATHVLVLSMHATSDYLVQALSAGASGYLLKECAGEELVKAVRAVVEGRRYFSASITPPPLEDLLRGGSAHALQRLSRREMQVLKLVVEGNTNHNVAASLGVSPKSVETYRSRLMAKLSISHLPALVKFAIRHGITTLE